MKTKITFSAQREIEDIKRGSRLTPFKPKIAHVTSLSQPHREQIEEIIKENFSHPFHPSLHDPQYFRDNLIFTAEFNKKVIGFLIFSKKDNYFEAIACSTYWARYGIGTKLFLGFLDHIDNGKYLEIKIS